MGTEAFGGDTESLGKPCRYFGVDLHKEQITWHCITRRVGEEPERTSGKVATARLNEDFFSLLSMERCYLIVEASSSTFFFYSQAAQYCTKAYIVNPSAFREMYMTGKKTDKIDAKKLADRLMYHVEMNDPHDGFPEVYVPDDEAIQLRKLITTYELLVKQMTQLKNQLKSIMSAKLIAGHDDVLDGGLSRLLGDSRIDDADRIMATSIAAVHASLGREKEAVKQAILEMGVSRFRKEVGLLITISGVSVMGAVVFMSDVVTVDRFASAKKLTSYLASVGKIDASGKTKREGGLCKRGRRTSYRFILQGLEHIVAGNEGFTKFKARHMGKRPNKVRAALVRKTFVAMYYMLKNGEVYRDCDERIYRRKARDFENLVSKVA